jgi:hypothetical protein
MLGTKHVSFIFCCLCQEEQHTVKVSMQDTHTGILKNYWLNKIIYLPPPHFGTGPSIFLYISE